MQLTIGTRGSKLALVQAEQVRAALLARHPGLAVALEIITTRGDVVLDRPLTAFSDKGLFVDEIEAALRAGRIQLAVHSAKDLPSELAADMTIGAFLRRADPRDVLVSASGAELRDLPPGARVGTSSLRRACQLCAARPDLDVRDIRGNVDTRLRKLHEGQYDAIVLAAAGLQRIDRADAITEYLEPAIMLPAVGQGALAVEICRGDEATAAYVAALDDPATRYAVQAERAFLARLGGGCKLPAAGYATVEGTHLHLAGLVGAADGRLVRDAVAGDVADGARLGETLAGRLLAGGGAALLDEARADAPSPPSPPPGPLAGRRIVITRAHEQSGPLLAELRALGAEALECPAIAIAPPADYAPLDAALRALPGYDWLLFTSANGVRAAFDRMLDLDMRASDPPAIRLPAGLRVGAIGPATAATLAEYGVQADFVPDTYVAEAVVAQIGDVAGQRILLPRADIARVALAEGLRAKGALVTQVDAYRTVPGAGNPRALALLAGGQVDAVAFTSSSTVRFFLDMLAEAGLDRAAARDALARTQVVCIGPITAATARECGIPVAAVADEYTAAGVVAALRALREEVDR
jgi:hydroxymethylbilane synthase